MDDQYERKGDSGRTDEGDDRHLYKEVPEHTKSASGFKLFLKVLAIPSDGWKELKRSKIMPDAYASGCFYPLSALVALSHFACFIYNPEAQLSPTLP